MFVNRKYLALLFCGFILGNHAAATTIATIQIQPGSFGFVADLDADELEFVTVLTMGPANQLRLFEEYSVSGLDDGLSLSWTADANNDTDFIAITTLLTNGLDDRIFLAIETFGGTGLVGDSDFESNWFADPSLPDPIDLAGFSITSIEMTMVNIQFQPFNGVSTSIAWDAVTFDIIGEPTQIPVPGALLLLVSALGFSIRWRKK